MHFDVNRMTRLAGLKRSSEEILAESDNHLSEIQNQRKRDEYGDEDEHGHQLAEGDDSDDDDWGGGKGEKSKTDPGEEDYTTKKGEKKKTSGTKRGTKKGDKADINEADELIEIDEVAIKREIIRMKQQRLAESRLRNVIRHELSDILEEAGYDLDSSWVYGDNKPRHSKKGQVALGTLGIGFE